MMHLEAAATQRTVLLVSNDGYLLSVGTAVLSSKNRVLKAWDRESAMRILQQLIIDEVVLHSGLADSRAIELECTRRGINVHFMSAVEEAGIVRMTMPEMPQCKSQRCAPAAC